MMICLLIYVLFFGREPRVRLNYEYFSSEVISFLPCVCSRTQAVDLLQTSTVTHLPFHCCILKAERHGEIRNNVSPASFSR